MGVKDTVFYYASDFLFYAVGQKCGVGDHLAKMYLGDLHSAMPEVLNCTITAVLHERDFDEIIRTPAGYYCGKLATAGCTWLHGKLATSGYTWLHGKLASAGYTWVLGKFATTWLLGGAGGPVGLFVAHYVAPYIALKLGNYIMSCITT